MIRHLYPGGRSEELGVFSVNGQRLVVLKGVRNRRWSRIFLQQKGV